MLYEVITLPHLTDDPAVRAAPAAGEIFRQPELLATLEKLVAAEREALAHGKSRADAIMAAYDRFYVAGDGGCACAVAPGAASDDSQDRAPVLLLLLLV